MTSVLTLGQYYIERRYARGRAREHAGHARCSALRATLAGTHAGRAIR